MRYGCPCGNHIYRDSCEPQNQFVCRLPEANPAISGLHLCHSGAILGQPVRLLINCKRWLCHGEQVYASDNRRESAGTLASKGWPVCAWHSWLGAMLKLLGSLRNWRRVICHLPDAYVVAARHRKDRHSELRLAGLLSPGI